MVNKLITYKSIFKGIFIFLKEQSVTDICS